MNEFQQLIEESAKADKIFFNLKSTNSINKVADTVESLDGNMAKLVLKKFVYSQNQYDRKTIERISQWLQDHGFEEASKAIDCKFDL